MCIHIYIYIYMKRVLLRKGISGVDPQPVRWSANSALAATSSAESYMLLCQHVEGQELNASN